MVKPRYILVGLAFAIFVAIPFTIVGASACTYRALKRFSTPASVMGAVVVLLYAPTVLATPFHYFVSTSTPQSIDLGLWWFDQGFWSIYEMFWLGLGCLLAFVATALCWAISHKLPPTMHRFFIVKLSLAPLFLLVPYTQAVFPNVDYSVGGAQPWIVSIDMSELSGASNDDIGQSKDRYVLWHMDSKFVYVAVLPPNGNPYEIIGLPIASVQRIAFRYATLEFERRQTMFPKVSIIE